MSKITDTAFTKCKVRLKNVFHVKKIFASVDFCLYFCAIQKTHYCKYYIWLFVLIVFHRPLFELNISLD